LTDLCFLGGNSGSCPLFPASRNRESPKDRPLVHLGPIQHHVGEELLRWRSLVHKKRALQ
jgi:hypothetical protein